MTQEEAKKKYLEYLEGHIGNVKEAFDLLCSLDIPFINENKDKLQAIINDHDKSKYDEPEWTAYLHHFYPTCDEDSLKTEEFEEACRHHISQNPHHWDYWMSDGELREDIDELEYKLYTVERLCDHMAMSIQNDNSPAEWYFANKDCIKMPDYGYELYEEMLSKVPDDYDLSFHGTRNDGEPEREAVNEDAIDDYIKSLEIDEDSILNNYRAQISNHYKYIRQVGRKINKAKYDDERNKLKKKQDFYKEVYKRLKSLNEDLYMNRDIVDSLGKRVKRSKTSNTIEIDTSMTNHDKQLDESVLNEMKLSQIKQKSKNEDPERVNRSKKVKTTYLGMSKFGILNFKTTSQSRNGHHYQTIEFKDLSPFEEIIKQGKEIMPMDVKKQLQEQDVNVWCTDESWAFWAWAHQAYKNDFLYIDDRIPNLKKAIQAPKVNNVRLNGGACKHIISVIDYCTRPFVLLAISDDMNRFLAGNKEDKMQKQTVATQNQYDMVANWDWSDIEEITGLSRIQIVSDISKTLQIIPKTDKGDIITDIVGEALPNEDQGLKRDIVDKIEELIDKEK